MYIDIKEIIKSRLKESNISLNEIIDFNISSSPDPSTFAPIVFLDLTTTKGFREVDLKFTNEMIQDVGGQGGSLGDDLESFRKELTRITNLNKLLHDNT